MLTGKTFDCLGKFSRHYNMESDVTALYYHCQCYFTFSMQFLATCSLQEFVQDFLLGVGDSQITFEKIATLRLNLVGLAATKHLC